MTAKPSPDSQTFHLKRRGSLIAQALIFLVFGGSCLIQAYSRYGTDAEQFWNAWWFFVVLAMGFGYLTVEAFYKFFYSRLELTLQEFHHYDFLKITRVPWEQVLKVGEIDLKDKRRIDFGLVLKDTAIERPTLLSQPTISLVPFFTSWNDSPLKAWFKKNQPGLLKEGK
ncbi:MAG: hypothetical protein ABIJ39_13900 [Chloroflexota bacterium]